MLGLLLHVCTDLWSLHAQIAKQNQRYVLSSCHFLLSSIRWGFQWTNVHRLGWRSLYLLSPNQSSWLNALPWLFFNIKHNVFTFSSFVFFVRFSPDVSQRFSWSTDTSQLWSSWGDNVLSTFQWKLSASPEHRKTNMWPPRFRLQQLRQQLKPQSHSERSFDTTQSSQHYLKHNEEMHAIQI